MSVCLRLSMHSYAYAYAYACIYAYACAYAGACVSVCVYSYVYIYVCHSDHCTTLSMLSCLQVNTTMELLTIQLGVHCQG